MNNSVNTNKLLSRQKIEGGVVSVIANAVWNKSRDIRDCVRIGTISRGCWVCC